MIRRPPRSPPLYSSAASDVYKRQPQLPRDERVHAGGARGRRLPGGLLSLIHISEPTRLRRISYAVFCLPTRLRRISYAVFCLQKKQKTKTKKAYSITK